jgi:hypothetical protein
MSALDHAVARHRAETALMLHLSRELDALPFGLDMETDFEVLGMDDAAINELADSVAREIGVRLRMPVACSSLGELAQQLVKAMERAQ